MLASALTKPFFDFDRRCRQIKGKCPLFEKTENLYFTGFAQYFRFQLSYDNCYPKIRFTDVDLL